MYGKYLLETGVIANPRSETALHQVGPACYAGGDSLSTTYLY